MSQSQATETPDKNIVCSESTPFLTSSSHMKQYTSSAPPSYEADSEDSRTVGYKVKGKPKNVFMTCPTNLQHSHVGEEEKHIKSALSSKPQHSSDSHHYHEYHVNDGIENDGNGVILNKKRKCKKGVARSVGQTTLSPSLEAMKSTGFHDPGDCPSPNSTIKVGYLRLRSGWVWTTWNRYYFVLKKSTLIYKKSHTDKKIAGFINLCKTSIWDAEDECGKKNSIVIYHPQRRPFYFCAPNAHAKRLWIESLTGVRDYLAQFEDGEEYTSSSDEEKEVSLCGLKLFFKLPHPFKRNTRHAAPIDPDVLQYQHQQKQKQISAVSTGTTLGQSTLVSTDFLSIQSSHHDISQAIHGQSFTPPNIKDTKDASVQTDEIFTTGEGKDALVDISKMEMKCQYHYCEQCPHRNTCSSSSVAQADATSEEQTKNVKISDELIDAPKTIQVNGQIDINMIMTPELLKRIRNNMLISQQHSSITSQQQQQQQQQQQNQYDQNETMNNLLSIVSNPIVDRDVADLNPGEQQNVEIEKVETSPTKVDANTKRVMISDINDSGDKVLESLIGKGASSVTKYELMNDEEFLKAHMAALCSLFSKELNISLNLSTISCEPQNK